MKSYDFFLFVTLLTAKQAICTSSDEMCEERGVAKNIREMARQFEHLSLQQKRKLKEWSSEKTLEKNLAAYNVTEMVKDMNLQQCVIVEIGEGFCSLFVETRNETGYSCNGTSGTRELFLGLCECTAFRRWRFCGSQLRKERSNDCTFREATSTQENSARVHRRLCDITQMIQWNTCNCSQSVSDQILLKTEGFPTCYRAPISRSVCYPRSVCGRSRCTPSLLAANVRSVQCDPDCPGGQPFCENPEYPTSIPPEISASWSDWDEPECVATSGEEYLVSRATCLDNQRGNCALDCIGPWKSCCPASLTPCSCDVSSIGGSLVATRTLGPCSSNCNKDELDPPQKEAGDLEEECTETAWQNETTDLLKSEGGECDSGKRLGTELAQKVMESLTGSFNLIPGLSTNARTKDKTMRAKQPIREVGERSVSKYSSSERRSRSDRKASRKRRRKRDIFESRRCLRRLLRWRKRDGQYEYEDESGLYDELSEVCKRDCKKTKPWEEVDAEIDMPEDEVNATTLAAEESSETECIIETSTTKPASAEKTSKVPTTIPQKGVSDIDEEEAEEDKGQDENESELLKSTRVPEQMPGQESEKLPDDDLKLMATSEKDGKHGSDKKSKSSKSESAQKNKGDTGKSGHHKSKIKEPEDTEGEEEVEPDPGSDLEREDLTAMAMSGGESQEMLDDSLQTGYGDSAQDEQKPNLAVKKSKSKAITRVANATLVVSATIIMLVWTKLIHQFSF